jgi:hypothetical protein
MVMRIIRCGVVMMERSQRLLVVRRSSGAVAIWMLSVAVFLPRLERFVSSPFLLPLLRPLLLLLQSLLPRRKLRRLMRLPPTLLLRLMSPLRLLAMMLVRDGGDPPLLLPLPLPPFDSTLTGSGSLSFKTRMIRRLLRCESSTLFELLLPLRSTHPLLLLPPLPLVLNRRSTLRFSSDFPSMSRKRLNVVSMILLLRRVVLRSELRLVLFLSSHSSHFEFLGGFGSFGATSSSNELLLPGPLCCFRLPAVDEGLMASDRGLMSTGVLLLLAVEGGELLGLLVVPALSFENGFASVGVFRVGVSVRMGVLEGFDVTGELVSA